MANYDYIVKIFFYLNDDKTLTYIQLSSVNKNICMINKKN